MKKVLRWGGYVGVVEGSLAGSGERGENKWMGARVFRMLCRAVYDTCVRLWGLIFWCL